jgi:urea transport system permease protein
MFRSFQRLSAIAAALVFTICMICTPSSPAWAGAYEDAVAGFTADSFSDTANAIAAIATMGDPRAAEVLQALQDQRLMFSAEQKKVYVQDAGGKLTDVVTGETIANLPGDLSNVRANNRVRGLLEAALGSLTLVSKDPARRWDAAQAVFKSRDENALPALEKAIAAETDASIRRAMVQARAAIIAGQDSASIGDRIAAVKILGERGDQDSLALLNRLSANVAPELKAAIGAAVVSVQRNLKLWEVAQNLWYGLSLGSVLLLAAIGLAITFGVMGIINMAHGEMVMIGAYTTFVVQQAIRSYMPGLSEWSLALSIPVAFLVAGAIGVAIERGIIRFLYGRPLETLLATWGLSLVLQQAVRTVFGPTNREVSAPTWMSGSFDVGQLSITYNRLWIIVFSMLVFAALLFVLRYTRFGLEMRAVTQNRPMAAAMGIRTKAVDALTFGLGSGIAGMAGVALSQIDNVSPNLGQGYIIDSFLVVVFGGVGNLFGTLVGALGLGIANKLLEPYAGAVVGKIVLLVLIILFIQKRPRGLFALKGRAVEA